MGDVKIKIEVNGKELAVYENGKLLVNLEELYEGITPLHELLEYLTSMSKIVSRH